jgi:membrane-associated phospholipid phosphatase
VVLQWLLLLLALLLSAGLALSVDLPVSRWCLQGICPQLLQWLLQVAEPFGNGMGVLLIVVVAYQLDPARRWALPRVMACALLGGIAADAVKLLVVRVRPRDFDLLNVDNNVWTTFGGWFPLTSAGGAGQSFPSGHAATAVALALALSWLYPRGRRLFPLLALLVACQRINEGAHYLSDTLCGAAVGGLVALVFLKVGPVPRWFDRWEHRWGNAGG